MISTSLSLHECSVAASNLAFQMIASTLQDQADCNPCTGPTWHKILSKCKYKFCNLMHQCLWEPAKTSKEAQVMKASLQKIKQCIDRLIQQRADLSKIQCFWCKEYGHYQSNCPKAADPEGAARGGCPKPADCTPPKDNKPQSKPIFKGILLSGAGNANIGSKVLTHILPRIIDPRALYQDQLLPPHHLQQPPLLPLPQWLSWHWMLQVGTLLDW